jgi:hypothetical protein
MHFLKKYLPNSLSKKDKKKQYNMLLKSKKMYKKGKYFTRKKVNSFNSKKSPHILKAIKLYNIENIEPNTELAKKSGCSISALNAIIKKGMGAYYSSGSRPNQTAESWGKARLASSITGGKASKVDFHIIKDGCNHTKKAYKLAHMVALK